MHIWNSERIIKISFTLWDNLLFGITVNTNMYLSSFTGVTKGVVSGVASMAASGGDSKVLNILGGCGSFGTGEFNSHFRLGVQKLALLTMLDAESILSPLLIESRSGNKEDGRGGGGYSSSLALSLASNWD